MNKQTALAPIIKTVTVPLDPASAFRLYTAGMATWWPLTTHAIENEQTTGVVVEVEVGGRIYETHADGSEADWGVVLAVVEGRRIEHTWMVSQGPSRATHIAVEFAQDPAGTLVTLTHGGWDLAQEGAADAHAQYDQGWDFVLGERFATAAASTGS